MLKIAEVFFNEIKNGPWRNSFWPRATIRFAGGPRNRCFIYGSSLISPSSFSSSHPRTYRTLLHLQKNLEFNLDRRFKRIGNCKSSRKTKKIIWVTNKFTRVSNGTGQRNFFVPGQVPSIHCPGTKGQRDRCSFIVPGQRDNGTS